MKPWRIIQDENNITIMPWRDAVGIEEFAGENFTPSVVCWFTRGTPIEVVEKVVKQHNKMITRDDIVKALCKRRGTAQCAAICLSHSSLHTKDGKCPEASLVFGEDADVILALFR